MFWVLIQLGIFIILLVISTFATWYEGSAILDNPWHWENSTPFSHFFSGEVQNPNQISQFDHFVYAAKFEPTFPFLMMISALYTIILIGYLAYRRYKKRFACYLFFLSVFLFKFTYLIFPPETVGGNLFFYFCLTCGILCIGMTVIIYLNPVGRLGKKHYNK
ncbi:YjdJ family protein [Halalkalibacter urbisdiaboli]|uniref:YjdJ family protein n=1 Tax=Halalkalibacter urbisdiaboli TaxID=1960589 RepID=UPI001FD8E117|nr:YjdJ family protein [Halalkalibacter urbisdiaboli]